MTMEGGWRSGVGLESCILGRAQGCAWIYWAVDRSGLIGGRMAAIFLLWSLP